MKTTLLCLLPFFLLLPTCCKSQLREEHAVVKDTIIYRVSYRDTIIYRYDTVQIRHYVHTDTLRRSPIPAAANDTPVKKRKVINPNNFGIGPSVGAYYSPFNGFDINIGFGVQYYFLSIPTIRKPHLHHHRK